MLTFVTTPQHAYTHLLFAERFGHLAAQPIHVAAGIPEDLASLNGSTVIWCDLERYRDNEIDRVAASQTAIAENIARRSLNVIGRGGRRHEVAARLFAAGVNSHRTLTASEFNSLAASDDVRYPVFLRSMFEHDGARTELLHSFNDVVMEVEASSIPLDEIAVVEFEDTSCSDGWFRKYGAFYVAGEVIPRHLFVSRNWMNKGAGADSRFRDEEIGYVMGRCHSRAISEIFTLCRLDYGRIDYSMKAGELVVFEINTNPTVIDRGDLNNAARSEATQHFVSRFAASLNAL